MADDHYKVIIIGTGAGGGTLAHRLAPSGKRVLLLETRRLPSPRAEDSDYPLGGVQMLGKSDAEQVRANAPGWAGRLAPEMPFEELAHHAVDFWLCGEDLPLPGNRVTLDGDGGVHLALDEKDNIDALNRLRHKLQSRPSDLGMHEKHLLHHSIYLHKGMPIGATAHQFSPRCALQGPRTRQPLRRRHQFLPEHRRGEPIPDGDRERAASRRSPPRTARVGS